MAKLASRFHASLTLQVGLLILLGSCGFGGGELPQAKPLPSGCLAQFGQESVEPAEHMALCDRIVASHPRLLRAHVDRFVVWQHYGREREACQKLFDVEKTMATLTFTPDDQDDFHFSVDVICRNQGGDG
ncbi:MAG: hypothetical protein F4Z75_05325 [Synechococcus sp. SB0668_bin_15]|nr:hypothetical protein [Synechococcus sp. SB0668_bin_15]MXZ82298.1 hypothetical protein [Synechococcus sp. SB0666_bin_14]MYC49550.1 hypothetical protein [Synechococcus sp. SB0662_bin_14]MYG46352.1 hypothetical protein [Synechococcus sp. SB0675_bin_6]MYJ59476.1 hypothetical protein [Synechococcus sp. SB0672_bin_6]MYK92297.1 hypothetical protein [Synechococcus sp. SB0669_bin_8]